MWASTSPVSLFLRGIMPVVAVYFSVLLPTWISWCVTTGGCSGCSFFGSAGAPGLACCSAGLEEGAGAGGRSPRFLCWPTAQREKKNTAAIKRDEARRSFMVTLHPGIGRDVLDVSQENR